MAALSVVLAALFTQTARATDPIDDPVEVPIEGQMTREMVGRAVKAALIRRGWKPGKEGAGTVEALLEKPDKYWVKIGIRYTHELATIRYVQSEGLYYDEESREIGGNYNKWMRMLSKEIGVNIALLASESPPPAPAVVVPVLREVAPVEPQPGPAAAVPAPDPAVAAPAAAPVAPAAPATLTLRAGTELRPRALASAASLSKVAAETVVTRKGPVTNPDGTWWYVTVDGTSGWVLATDFR